MDNFGILTLISEGESSRLDFKRQLDVDSADGKAEFVKDLVALANSARDVGYLLIGVEDTRLIVGTKGLAEEQIQQIAHTYITPPIILRCSLVPTHEFPSTSIGIIEVEGPNKPHKVARAIGRLGQDDVFIRRGTVTTKASPEEIHDMYLSGQAHHAVQRYISAAAAHLKAQDYESAADAYSKAIADAPSYSLYLTRGEAYELALEQHRKAQHARISPLPSDRDVETSWQKIRSLARSALSDFARAVRLADSREAEKTARLKLFRRGCLESSGGGDIYPWKQRESDLQWLRQNLDNRELGEAIYLFVSAFDLCATGWKAGEDTVNLMDEAIQLGYADPSAYYLRARGHLLAGNFGMAVRDTDRSLSHTDQQDTERIVELQCIRAEALCGAGRFDEAHRTLVQARKTDPELVRRYLVLAYELDLRILCECGLKHEFYGDELHDPLHAAVRVLALWSGRGISPDFHHLEEECPGITRYLRGILGEDLWSAMQNDPHLRVELEMPTLRQDGAIVISVGSGALRKLSLA